MPAFSGMRRGRTKQKGEPQSEGKRGFGCRGSMVNEDLNHPNETYELVSRILLLIFPSAT